jgi:hypothetical protein
MHYEAALKAWGAKRLERTIAGQIDPATVEVRMKFDAGFACCGGRDPECYCSFATSPTADILITGVGPDGMACSTTIGHSEFDFASVHG